MLVFPVQLETGGHGFQSLLELVVDGLRRRALALQRRLRVGHHTLRGAAHADDSRVRERKLESVRRADVVEGLGAALYEDVEAGRAEFLHRPGRELHDLALGPLGHRRDVLAHLWVLEGGVLDLVSGP